MRRDRRPSLKALWRGLALRDRCRRRLPEETDGRVEERVRGL